MQYGWFDYFTRFTLNLPLTGIDCRPESGDVDELTDFP